MVSRHRGNDAGEVVGRGTTEVAVAGAVGGAGVSSGAGGNTGKVAGRGQ